MEGLGNLILMAFIYVIWQFIQNTVSGFRQKDEKQVPPVVYRQNNNASVYEKIKKQQANPAIDRQEAVNFTKKELKNKTHSEEESIKKPIDVEVLKEDNRLDDIFEITNKSIINGIIMKEVLGPPKANDF
jgi:hypothetical protein